MKRGLQVERKGERKGGDKNGKGERSGVQQKSRVEGEGKHTKGGELKEFFLKKITEEKASHYAGKTKSGQRRVERR